MAAFCRFRFSDNIMQAVLDDPAERDVRIFKIPLSGIRQDGQKINYYDFIYSGKNQDCNAALKRILPRIDMNKIDLLIDETPLISDLQKRFYQTLHHKTGQIIALPLLIANALCWMILMRHIDSAWLTSTIALLFPQIH